MQSQSIIIFKFLYIIYSYIMHWIIHFIGSDVLTLPYNTQKLKMFYWSLVLLRYLRIPSLCYCKFGLLFRSIFACCKKTPCNMQNNWAAHKTATANFFEKTTNTFVVFKKMHLGQCNIVRAKLLIDFANDIIFYNTQ